MEEARPPSFPPHTRPQISAERRLLVGGSNTHTSDQEPSLHLSFRLLSAAGSHYSKNIMFFFSSPSFVTANIHTHIAVTG